MLYDFHWVGDSNEGRFAVAFFVSLAPIASPDFPRSAAVEVKIEDTFGSLGLVRCRRKVENQLRDIACPGLR